MSDDELLHNMSRAFWASNGGSDNSMRAVLDVLHAHGYRRCAEGRAVTQWCAEAERVRANLKALEDGHIAYADDVGDALGQRKGEPLLTCARRVVAEVERLREALKSTAAFLHHCWCDVQMSDYSFQRLSEQMEIIDAAIDAAMRAEG